VKHLVLLLGLVIGLVIGACSTSALVEPWQLDHDRLVAVRATPPHVTAGKVAMLDALVAHAGAPTSVEAAKAATAAFAPARLFTAVNYVFGTWEVIGPDETQLAAARTELGLPTNAPVPLDVTLVFPGSHGTRLDALKTVWLGDAATNPSIAAVTVAGQPAGASLVVPREVDVALAIDAGSYDVSWLTSCGTLQDANDHNAVLHIEAAAPSSGELVVVVRDDLGGVAWQVWPITAE
jgi:hypothetical protein